jgi:membrane protein implicated in regulation of membrane protease activity
MRNWWYGLYALILGVLSLFTGEIVTFIMLGFILLSLVNINTTLKKIYEQRNGQSNQQNN